MAMTLKPKPCYPNRSVQKSQDRSNVRLLLTVFFDCNGMVQHEFLPQDHAANKEYYLQVMVVFANCAKQFVRNAQNCGKTNHWSMHVHGFFPKKKKKTVIKPQPPYSTDLAPANFFLFPKLKTPMKGKSFATIEEIKEKSKQELLAKSLWSSCLLYFGIREQKQILIIENRFSAFQNMPH